MAENTVEIGIKFNIEQAEERLQKINEAISALNANTDNTEEEVKALEHEYDVLSEYLEKAKAASDNTSESFAKQAKSLNDTQDIAQATGDTISLLGVAETGLGSAVAGTSSVVNKSIRYIKGMSKALDAMKTSATGAGGAVGFLRKALELLAKNWILIAVTALVTVIGKLASAYSDFQELLDKSNFKKMEKSIENLNKKYERQAELNSLLGKRSSENTDLQIKKLTELNKKLGIYSKNLKSAYDGEFEFGKVVKKYLEGDISLYGQLDDKNKEIVETYAKYQEMLEQNNYELDQILPKMKEQQLIEEAIADAEYEYSMALEKVSQKYDGLLTRMNSGLQVMESQQELMDETNGLSETYLENELKINEAQEKILNTELQRNNEMQNALQKQINAIDAQIIKAEKAGNIEQRKTLELERQSLVTQKIGLENDRQVISTQKTLNNIRLQASFTRSMLDNVQKLNRNIMEIENSYLDLIETGAFEKISSYDYFQAYNSMFLQVGHLYGELQRNMTTVKADAKALLGYDVKEISDLAYAAAQAKQEFETLGDDQKLRKAQLLDFISSANNAMQEWTQTNNEMINRLESRGLSMVQKLSEAIQTVGPEIKAVFGQQMFGDGPYSMAYMSSYLTQASGYFDNITVSDGFSKNMFEMEHELKQFQKQIDDTIELYHKWKDEGENAFSGLTYDQKKYNDEFFNLLSSAGVQAETFLTKLSEELKANIREIERSSAEATRQAIENEISFMERYSDVGELTLKKYYDYRQQLAFEDKRARERDVDDQVELMRKAGVEETAIADYVKQAKLQIDREYAAESEKITRESMRTKEEIAANVAGNINSISENMFSLEGEMSDANFERNKNIQGATLIASTYANAAQAFGSTYAQAPGGVAAKTIQAGIASAAVLASGIAAYNKLMATTKDTRSISDFNDSSQSFTPVDTGTSSVANTFVGQRYNKYNQDIQPVLVVDEVTFKQQQQSNLRKIATI